jgi:amino acid transporter
MTKQSYADTSDWSIPGYDGSFGAASKVNADEPKNEFRIGIDDIVYNRVPLFDINVFSDKPGGKDIDTTSPLYFLRQIVANWFVMGMELALVAMVIIIMYTGIRMALTTIAEKKAEYKEMLFSFVKAIAKIFVLVAIMALIINICQYLTSLFAEHGPDPSEPISGKNLYVTIIILCIFSS